MNFKDILEIYSSYSKQSGEIVRQMGLAGIALIWASKIEGTTQFSIEPSMIGAGIFLLLGLTCDLLQYVIGAIIWQAFLRSKEKSDMANDVNILVPTTINWPTTLFFWLKIVAILTGYIFLIQYLIRRLIQSR